MKLGEFQKQIEKLKQDLNEYLDWTEEELQEVEIHLLIEGEETGCVLEISEIQVDAPPLAFYISSCKTDIID